MSLRRRLSLKKRQNRKGQEGVKKLVERHKKEVQKLTDDLKKTVNEDDYFRIEKELGDATRHLQLAEEQLKAMEAGTEPAFRGYQQLLKKQLAEVAG